MGSGISISYAGPGVLLSYVVAACIALAVTYSLCEMAVAHPTAGSFGVYADLYLSPWIGFLVRYTQFYLCTRMLFSLARSNDAPAALGVVNSRGTPWGAAFVSVVGVLIAAATAYVSDKAYNYLFGIALFSAIVTWIIILVTHLVFIRKYPPEKRAQLPVRTPLSPYLQWLGVGLLIAVLITMGLDREFWRISIVVGVPWVILVSGCYLLLVRARRKRPEAGHAGAVLVKVNE